MPFTDDPEAWDPLDELPPFNPDDETEISDTWRNHPSLTAAERNPSLCR